MCGDSICSWPAEFGGAGSFNDPQRNPSDPEAECSFCETDCGECDPETCYPTVCEDDYGQCRPCELNSECPSGEYCTFFGECDEIPYVECNENLDCTGEFGQGWYCDQNENPYVCKPYTRP